MASNIRFDRFDLVSAPIESADLACDVQASIDLLIEALESGGLELALPESDLLSVPAEFVG